MNEAKLKFYIQIIQDLTSIYEEIRWLSERPTVSSAQARAWYTHIMAESIKKRIRRFSGQVSEMAITNFDGELRLEHYKRMQATLTELFDRHRLKNLNAPEEFIKVILDCEQVHIVTRAENDAAKRKKGDYEKAGINLKKWDEISLEVRHVLWQKMLQSKVANAREFRVEGVNNSV